MASPSRNTVQVHEFTHLALSKLKKIIKKFSKVAEFTRIWRKRSIKGMKYPTLISQIEFVCVVNLFMHLLSLKVK